MKGKTFVQAYQEAVEGKERKELHERPFHEPTEINDLQKVTTGKFVPEATAELPGPAKALPRKRLCLGPEKMLQRKSP